MFNKRDTPGSFLLKLRQKYGYGIRTAYYRDQVRPRILETTPIECGRDPRCEIHVLTSAGDWLNLMWALKSFYCYSGRRYPLCIHDDGTLGQENAARLLRHFPGARVIERERADREVATALERYPRCLQFRRSNHLAPKIFDFIHYLTADRMLLLDSDVLFFALPETLLKRIEDPEYLLNSVNEDIESAYTVQPEDVKDACGMVLQPRFNSGLGLIHRQSMRFGWIEEFLELPGIVGHFWRIEQTLYALCSSRFGVELLPGEYSVRIEVGIGRSPSRHYTGAMRQLMYSEGMRRLMSQRFPQVIEEAILRSEPMLSGAGRA